VSRERLTRDERALAAGDAIHRAAIIGRCDIGRAVGAHGRAMDRPSPDAARKLTERAVRRLVVLMQPDAV